MATTHHDLYYLRSIKRNLDELRGVLNARPAIYGLAGMTLDDNRNWLDCFIVMCESELEVHDADHPAEAAQDAAEREAPHRAA
jgi:hypothetical protein